MPGEIALLNEAFATFLAVEPLVFFGTNRVSLLVSCIIACGAIVDLFVIAVVEKHRDVYSWTSIGRSINSNLLMYHYVVASFGPKIRPLEYSWSRTHPVG